ncbi:MAG: isopentenyl-diphosphate Delta-isomerase [Candidatus Micrarchaeota archaeon]|nr:isopentenyl-diphosphate Delta-isomerase [Candidatus Micrarchaeota archaeon]
MENINVVLVDENDNEIGLEEKLKAHQNGAKLHRAVSVLLFNSKGQLLMQRRALSKYHSQGKWANTCCSHPFPGEDNLAAAQRRLKEEMGVECRLKEAFHYTYKAEVGNGLTEHEYDHIFFGEFDGMPKPNKDEVMDWKWMSLKDLRADMSRNPQNYAPWLSFTDEVINRRN